MWCGNNSWAFRDPENTRAGFFAATAGEKDFRFGTKKVSFVAAFQVFNFYKER